MCYSFKCDDASKVKIKYIKIQYQHFFSKGLLSYPTKQITPPSSTTYQIPYDKKVQLHKLPMALQ